MSQSVSTVSVLVGYAALQAFACVGSAVSPEAESISKAATAIVDSVEQSRALFGAKADAISRLLALASEYASDNTTSVDPCAIVIAQGFLRALPEGVALPEFSVEPGGSISLDWIESRSRLFSLSIGGNHRFAYAWLDGTNKGHGVESFDGQQIPERLLDGITAIVRNGNASIRPA